MTSIKIGDRVGPESPLWGAMRFRQDGTTQSLPCPEGVIAEIIEMHSEPLGLRLKRVIVTLADPEAYQSAKKNFIDDMTGTTTMAIVMENIPR